QAVCILATADWGGEARSSRRVVSRGSLHAAESHVPLGETRVHPVVHLFRLAADQIGIDPVFHGIDQDGCAGIFPAQSLAQYPGYLDGAIAARRPSRFYVALHLRRYAGS